MTVTGALALYFIIWWITLFAVLPLWVRSQHEDGAVTDGTEPGAPVVPRLGLKLLVTTVAALPIFGLVWALIEYVD